MLKSVIIIRKFENSLWYQLFLAEEVVYATVLWNFIWHVIKKLILANKFYYLYYEFVSIANYRYVYVDRDNLFGPNHV